MRYINVLWILKNVKNPYLFWSNSMGWVSIHDVTVFTPSERLNDFGVPEDGKWVRLVSEEILPIEEDFE